MRRSLDRVRRPGAGAGHNERAFHVQQRPGNAGRAPELNEVVDPVRNPEDDVLVMGGAGVAMLMVLVLSPWRWLSVLLGAFVVAVPLIYSWPPFRWMPTGLVKAEGLWSFGQLFALPLHTPPWQVSPSVHMFSSLQLVPLGLGAPPLHMPCRRPGRRDSLP